MPEAIETAFVRIRPDFSGFRQEASARLQGSLGGVQTQLRRTGSAASGSGRDLDRFGRGLVATEARALGFGRALAFASTAFLGGAGIGALVHTATSEFAQFTQIGAATNAILAATGGAANVTAKGVQELASQLEHKTGIDDEQIKSAENVLLTFTAVRNEVGRQNDIFNRATKAAVDLSRVFGTDVPSTARQLGRALQDPARGLLTLRRAGLTFTAGQTKLIKSLADSGQQLRAQNIILGEVERRVGGTAAAVGRTLPGQLNILRERAKDALGEYVKRLSESQRAADLTRAAGQRLAEGFRGVKEIVQTLAPPVEAVAKAASGLTLAVGVGPLLAAAAAFKAVGIASGLAKRSQALYARAAAVAAGATAEETVTTVGYVSALRVQSVALGFASNAQRGYTVSTGLASAANVELAATTTAASIAARASAIGLGASRLALAAVGGPVGAVALGVGALVAGLVLLRRRAQDAAGGVNATRRALELLDAAIAARQATRSRIGIATGNVAQAQAQRRQALADIAAVQRAQARSTAQPGSLEQLALADRLRAAQGRLAKATADLALAEGNLGTQQQKRLVQQRLAPGVVERETASLVKQFTALRDDIIAKRLLALPSVPIGAADASEIAKKNLAAFLQLTDRLATSGSKAERAVATALHRVAAETDKLPTRKEITLAVRLSLEGASLKEIERQLGVAAQNFFVNPAAVMAAAFGVAIKQATTAQTRENAALQQAFEAAKKRLAAEEKILATKKQQAQAAREQAQGARDAVASARDQLQSQREQLAAARENVRAAKEQVTAARQQITAAREQVTEARAAAREQIAAARSALRDTITSGRQAVNQAVQEGKGNLRSIADSIAEAVGRLAERSGQSLSPSGPLAARFRQLRDQIIAGRGGPTTAAAARAVSATITAQQNRQLPDVAERVTRRLDDLADAFARHRITIGRFNQGLDNTLKSFGFSRQAFGKAFGAAALHDLDAAIAAARAQAGALAAGPQRPGGGTDPAITRPLDAVQQATKDTKAATKDVKTAITQGAKDTKAAVGQVTDAVKGLQDAVRQRGQAQLEVERAQRDIARTERELARDQLKQARLGVAELKAIRAAVEAANRVKAADAAKTKAKPAGGAAKTANQTTAAGANPP